MEETPAILSISNKKKKKFAKKTKEMIQNTMSSVITPMEDSLDALGCFIFFFSLRKIILKETIMPS